MINSNNFANTKNGAPPRESDSDIIARARELASEEEEPQGKGKRGRKDRKKNNGGHEPKPKGSMSRRKFLIGAGAAAVVAAGGFSAWWFLFREPPKPEPEPEPEPEEVDNALNEFRMEGGTLIVGQTEDENGRIVKPGFWVVDRFPAGAETWLSIQRGNKVYSLALPESDEDRALWANQYLVCQLEENDKVTADAQFTRVQQKDLPQNSLENIRAVTHSGMLVTTVDLEPGVWSVTPRDVTKDIDKETLEAIDGNHSWEGRVAAAIGRVAKENGKTIEQIQNEYVGIVVLPHTEAQSLFGPLMGANVPFMEEYASIPEPSKEKDEKGKGDERKDDAAATEAPQEQPQPAPATNAPPAEPAPADVAPADAPTASVLAPLVTTLATTTIGEPAPAADATDATTTDATTAEAAPTPDANATQTDAAATGQTEAQPTSDTAQTTAQTQSVPQDGTATTQRQTQPNSVAKPSEPVESETSVDELEVIRTLLAKTTRTFQPILDEAQVTLNPGDFVFPILVDMSFSHELDQAVGQGQNENTQPVLGEKPSTTQSDVPVSTGTTTDGQSTADATPSGSATTGTTTTTSDASATNATPDANATSTEVAQPATPATDATTTT